MQPMGTLTYSMGVSLDGHISGPGGEIDWSAPDEELHRFHNQETRALGTHFVGRRLYEEMLPWETVDEDPSAPEHMVEFARVWKALPKVVFSTTLDEVQGNARLATGSPAEEVARWRQESGGETASVGGAGLAAAFIENGLVDEFHLFVSPVVLGGGTRYFPALDQRLDLQLVDTRAFGPNVLFLRYRLKPPGARTD
jgi:dihydrofolate reductase